jgi:hypothetical protein
MSAPSRRSVIRGAAVTAAAVAMPTALAGPAFAATASPLRRSTFRPWLGKAFTLTSKGKSYSAKLVEIGDFNKATAGSDRAFTLLFSGSVPPAGICVVSSAKACTFSLFLAPVTAKTGLAQAVISA